MSIDLDNLRPFSISEVAVVDLPHVSSRITLQKAVFTIHPLPQLPIDQWSLRVDKMVVEGSSRVGIRNELRTFGGDRGSLFPELGGIAQGLNALRSSNEPLLLVPSPRLFIGLLNELRAGRIGDPERHVNARSDAGSAFDVL